VATDPIGFETANVPQAEPYVDDECNIFEDVDVKLGFGGVVSRFAIRERAKGNHVVTMCNECVAMDAPHEEIRRGPASQAFIRGFL
jgi:hypothetical protein